MQRLLLKQNQAPGDVVVMTAAIRDLMTRFHHRFRVAVDTLYPELWQNNPHVLPPEELGNPFTTLKMEYPAIHQSNVSSRHFVEAYHAFLRAEFGIDLQLRAFRGDIHLSEREKEGPPAHLAGFLPEKYWLLCPCAKPDFTAKWWSTESWQDLVDLAKGQISFVQVGSLKDWNPELRGTINAVGKTSLRDLIALVYHCEGIVSLVSLPMHLAAAVPMKPGPRKLRPCVVIAGGREPAHWEAYPGHAFLHTIGQLDCCASGGCWRSRCQLVEDFDRKEHRDLCEQPVQVGHDLRIARCMDSIAPLQVFQACHDYYFSWERRKNP